MYYQNRGTSVRSPMKPRASATKADRTTESHAALPPVQERGRIFVPKRPPAPKYTTEEESLDFADNPPSGRPGSRVRGAIDYRRRTSANEDQTHTQAPSPMAVTKYEPRRRFGKRAFLGLAAGVASTIIIGAGLSKVGQIRDGIVQQWTYGPDPRTFHIDAVVGHHDSAAFPSHFIAINWHGTAVLEEWPGGDFTKPIRYVGPRMFSDQQIEDLPVTLQFRDLNHDGLPDMIIQFNDQGLVMINDQALGQFRAPKPGETYSV